MNLKPRVQRTIAAALATVQVLYPLTSLAAEEFKLYIPGLMVTGDTSSQPSGTTGSGSGSTSTIPKSTSTAELTPATLTFDDLAVGYRSSPKTMTLTNKGTQEIVLEGTPLITGRDFSLAGTTCGATLAAGASCDVSILFSPTTSGALSATITFPNNSANGPQVGNLLGKGLVSKASASWTPSLLDFKGVLVGKSVTKAVKLVNKGVKAANWTDLQGAPTGFKLDASDCSNVPAGGYCTVQVTFTPVASVAYSGAGITTVAGLNANDLSVQGLGMAQGFDFSAGSLDFGTQLIGTTSGVKSVAVSNTGSSALSMSMPAISGPFTLTTDCGASLAAGATCYFNVKYTPAEMGPTTGEISFSSAGGAQSISLLGTGTQPMSVALSSLPVTIQTPTGTFPYTSLGSISKEMLIFVKANGNLDTLAVSAALTGSPDFSLVAAESAVTNKDPKTGVETYFTGSCGGTLTPTGVTSCVASPNSKYASTPTDILLHVRYAPTGATGVHTGVLTINHNGPNTSPLVVNLSGMATPAQGGSTTTLGAIDFSTWSLAFGDTDVGATPAQTVRLTNTGSSSFKFTAPPTITGDATFAFASGGGTNCGTSLQPGGYCDTTVVYSPTAPASAQGILTFTTDTPGVTSEIALSGNGVVSGATLGAAPGFTSVFAGGIIGQTSTNQFVLKNTGNKTLTGVQASVTAGQDLSITGNTCGTEVPGGSSCNITVAYTPTTASALSGAALTVASSAKNSPVSVSLSSTTEYAADAVSTTSLSNFTALVGGTSVPQGFKVYSTGNKPVQLTSVTSTGPFTVTSPDCALPVTTLKSCTFNVQYAPMKEATADTGSISVVTSIDTKTISLSGGVATALTVSGSPDFGLVKVGMTGTKTLTLNNPSAIVAKAVTAALASGTPASVTITANTCQSANVPAGGTCSVTVQFAPTTEGPLTNAAVVLSAANAGSITTSLAGVTQKALLSVSTSTLSFGATNSGDTTNTRVVTVSNTGNAPLTFNKIDTTGSEFTATNNCGATLNAASNCQVTVTYTPAFNASAASASSMGGLNITTDAGDATVVLSGTDYNLLVSGTMLEGTASGVLSIATSTGTPLVSPTSVGLYQSGTLVASSTSVSWNSTSNVLTANFGPVPNAGKYTLQVLNNKSQVIGAAPAAVQGAAGELVAAKDSSADFGVVLIGANQTETYTFTNVGTVSLTGVVPSVSGNSALTVKSTTCAATLAVGASCDVVVQYTPTVEETLTGTVSVKSSATSSPAKLNLTGKGQVVTEQLSTTSLSGFKAILGGNSTPQAFSVTSTGARAVDLTSVTVTGPFTVASANCALPVTNFNTCSFNVVYAPRVAADKTGTGTVTVTTSAYSRTVSLSGTASELTVTGSADFGNVDVGGALARTLTFNNPTEVAAQGVTAALGVGTPSTIRVLNNACTGVVVQPGGSCSITVEYAPTEGTPLTGASVTFTATNGQGLTRTLTGSGFFSALSVSATLLSFASQAVNTTSAAKAVALINDNTGAVAVSSVSVTGPYAASTDCGLSIAAKSTCYINVTYKPVSVTSAQTGALTIVTEAGTQTVSLTGTAYQGLTAALSASAGSVTTPNGDFGPVGLNTTVTKTIYVKIAGNDRALVTSASLTGDASYRLVNLQKLAAGNATPLAGCGSYVTATAANDCPSDAVGSGPYTEAALTVQITPTTEGTKTATVSIVHNGTNTSPLTVALTAQAFGTPVATLSGFSGAFPDTAMGGTNQGTVVLTNTGTKVMAVSSVAVTGDTSFSLVSNACGSSLAVGASCNIVVSFTAASTTAVTGTLTVTTDGGVKTLALSGTSPQGDPAYSAGSVDLGTVQLGQAVTTSAITLENQGTAPLTNLAITAPTGFAIVGNTCPSTLNVGDVCWFQVYFAPTAVKAYSGDVVVAVDGGLETLTVTGTGVAPSAALSVTSLTFASTKVGVTTTAKQVTLMNTGYGPVSVSTPTITGDYAVTNNCPTSLAVGASCVLNVTFKPTVTGTRTGTLSVPTSAGLKTVSLTGTGTP